MRIHRRRNGLARATEQSALPHPSGLDHIEPNLHLGSCRPASADAVLWFNPMLENEAERNR